MKSKPSIASQRGAALAVSLILLLILTVLGASSVQSTLLDEKMAANYKDRDAAFQAAEAALRFAETVILNTSASDFSDTTKWPNVGSLSSTGGLLGLTYADGGIDYSADSGIWTTAGSYQTYDHPDLPAASDPRFIIKYESQPSVSPAVRVFKITVFAQGKSAGTRVVLRSFYERTN